MRRCRAKATAAPSESLPLIAAVVYVLLALLLLAYAFSSARGKDLATQRDGGGIATTGTCTVDDTGTEERTFHSDAAAVADAAERRLEPERRFADDPNMLTMPDADFKAYVRPDVSEFYNRAPGTLQEADPEYTGQAGKFVNMSPQPMHVYWEPTHKRAPVFQVHTAPFGSAGNGNVPGHVFTFRSPNDPSRVMCNITVVEGTLTYFYDPFARYENEAGWCAPRKLLDMKIMNGEERKLYERNRFNNEFGKKYKEFTGADWLTLYPRSRPRHEMWSAYYFGQQHSVQTRETQFRHLPPPNTLGRVSRYVRNDGADESVPFPAYRGPLPGAMTLTAVSCAPRVFEITMGDGSPFLSTTEADHVLDLATRNELIRDKLGQGHGVKAVDALARTSHNTWLDRESSPIIDAIYRRAADVLRVDESLLRDRGPDERPELETRRTVAESLNIVHYDVGEQYIAHHDFGYPTAKQRDHASRWANIFIYLNDGMEGGELSFPRWRNAHTSDPLKIMPHKGTAILLYMMLPDGNLDHLSQHAALPVTKGEKWMANLWIWDPFRNN